jgi:hypothetical protein
MLAALDFDAIALREEFPEDIKDIPLFLELKGSGCIYLSADISQTTRMHEARALKESGVTSLFFGPFWNRLTLMGQAAWLVAKWPKIVAYAETIAAGTCAEMKQNGKVHIITT